MEPTLIQEDAVRTDLKGLNLDQLTQLHLWLHNSGHGYGFTLHDLVREQIDDKR